MDMQSTIISVPSSRWSDRRACQPWRLNSLETIVPENLPRPSARGDGRPPASLRLRRLLRWLGNPVLKEQQRNVGPSERVTHFLLVPHVGERVTHSLGMPFNKSLYTISYLMVTSASSGITFCILYALVDVYGWRRLTYVLEWVGKHSLSIFILVTSNIVVIIAQGFYLKSPDNNIVHWIVTRFVHMLPKWTHKAEAAD